MPSFSGQFQISGGRSGPCGLSFDKDALQIVSGGGPALACDLGDIDVFAPGDYLLDLTFFTGQQLRLHEFGKAFDNLVHDLLEAYRARLVQCLLLDDLEEVSRFTGTAGYQSAARSFCGPSEIRLYKSNVAFLPTSATGLQWRLADVDSVRFDAATYATVLQSRDEQITVTKLAKRTDEFRERVEAAMQAVGEASAHVLHGLFPFVAPDRFANLAAAMKEGHAASLATLKAIDPKTPQAIVSTVVDAKLRPYFNHLAKLAGEAGTFAGFKMIRAEDTGESGEAADEAAAGEAAAAQSTPGTEPAADGAPDSSDPAAVGGEPAREDVEEQGEAGEQPVLHWFFFRIAPPAAKEPVLAWEATSRAGRATYLFRESALTAGSHATVSPDAVAERLARGLALVNFRREPVYLPDDSLQMQPKFRRYAIASRRLPDLASLRRAFIGRAIHTTPDTWRRQLDALLA
jgi:hypothetical protein